jgi:tRNA synthetases class I (E and Q), catalytic domain
MLLSCWNDGASTSLPLQRRQILGIFPVVAGFAYAPNFITKIIQEDTGISPFTIDTADDTPIDDAPSYNGMTMQQQQKQLSRDSNDDNDHDEYHRGRSNTFSVPPVVTRFPPEPNGYLHLGHAKAISFNFAVARMFHGTCNLRMDDTNPSKEDEEYVQSILEDVKWVQSGLYDEPAVPWEGQVRKTSDYFDTIYDCAEALIQQGDAYVDSLSAEEMREYRGTLTESGRDSPYRNRSVQENLDLFRKVRVAQVEKTMQTPDLTCLDLMTLQNICSDEKWRMPRRRACFESQD